MKTLMMVVSLMMVGLGEACIGDGCIHDNANNRFFWISDRAISEVGSVAEQGGPTDYCNSLGLTVTERGSNLWSRAILLKLDREMFEESRREPAFPTLTICHKQRKRRQLERMRAFLCP